MNKYSFSHLSRKEFRHAVKRADPSIFSDLLQFLEDDPRTFGSGYLKERAWKYIKRYDLSSNDIGRLENTALKYLFRSMSHEFRYMCQTMCRIASDGFWENVKSYLNSDNEIAKLNASCLYPYSDGMKAGETLRLAWKNHGRWMKWKPYKTNSQFYTCQGLINLLKEPENWQNGDVLYRDAPERDLPILYYNPKHDLDVATLDISKCNKNIVLEKLENLFSEGELDVWNMDSWIYTIYLMRYLEDERAVSIIINFLETKIDYKFESVKKNLIQIGCFKLLRHYDTQESRLALEKYKYKDEEFSNYEYPDSLGWLATYPK